MWKNEYFERLENTKTATFMGGGQARIDKQHARGKLTARERLEILFDEGSFHELNQMTECRTSDFGMDKKRVAGDGVVTGWGLVNGRQVFASSQDFTVCGGAGGEEYALKICKILEKAIEMRAPFVNLNDSGGARIEEGICSLSAYSRLFYLNTVASGLIPQIAVIMGPCAGGASYSPALCDFIFMVKNTSQMYITGPQVIKTVTREDVTAEALGGSDVHMRTSGVAHFSYPDERRCLEAVKRLLGYLPQNNHSPLPEMPGTPRDWGKYLPEVVSDNSRLSYDVRTAIIAMVDKGSFLEVHKDFARNIVVGFGRMDGQTVGFVANQPNYLGGSIDCDAGDKSARFIRFCDCYNIPLVSFVDVPAFLPGTDQEKKGIIRHGAKLLYAFSEATVSKVCVILRKAYGGAFCAMNSKNMSADVVYAWPIAQIAVMGTGGAVNIIFRKQIESAADPDMEREKLTAEYEEKFMNPYFAASRGFVDEVITPAETRTKIKAALDMLKSKKQERPWKKHGNMPL